MSYTKKFVVLALLGLINFSTATEMADENYLGESEFMPQTLAEADLENMIDEDSGAEVMERMTNPKRTKQTTRTNNYLPRAKSSFKSSFGGYGHSYSPSSYNSRRSSTGSFGNSYSNRLNQYGSSLRNSFGFSSPSYQPQQSFSNDPSIGSSYETP